ncbi:MAG: O-antigen ligase family protein [Acidobacteriota bacterium]
MDTGSRWALVAIVVLAPLPFGAVLGWTTSLIASAVGLLAAVTFLRFVRTPTPLPAGTGLVALAGGLLAVPGLVQIVPIPARLVAWISPATAAFYRANQAGTPRWLTLSQDVSLTTAALLWLGACTAAALLVVLLFDRRRVRHLLLAVVGLGVAESFYGVLEFLSGSNHIFRYQKRYYLDSATGTYINRNHFAGLLVMLLPVGLAFLLAGLGRLTHADPASTWRQRLLRLADGDHHRIILLGLAVAVMAAGLGLSFSRAGVTFGLLALAATAAAHGLARSRRRFGRSRGALAWACGLLLLAAVPLAVRGPGRLGTMSDDIPVELTASTGRPTVWAATFRMASDYPLFGTGLGTFPLTFPRYRPASIRNTYTEAHQDYLQWFSETGLLGVLAGALVLVGVGVVARRAIRRSAQPADRILAVGVTAGLAGIAFHGLVDFNGHIPANTLMTSVLAASLLVLGRDTTQERPA